MPGPHGDALHEGFFMKKYVCIFFSIVLIITAPVRVYASAASGTLTVASGSGSAVGGLFSDYGLNSKTSAIALTMVLLNSLGATVKLTDQAIQAGKKVEDVIMDKFAQWVGGSSAESMTEEQREELKKRFKVINGGSGNNESGSDGPNVGPDGKIYFGLGALGILTEFIKFLKSNNDIQDYQQSDSDTFTTVDLGPFSTVVSDRVWDVGNDLNYNFNFTRPCAILRWVKSDSKTYGYIAICKEDFDITSDTGKQYNAEYSKGYYYDSTIRNAYIDFNPPGAYGVDYNYSSPQVIDMITKWDEQAAGDGISEDGIYKGANYDDSIVDNPTNPIVVDPGILPNVTPESDQQVSIPDYLQMILDNANANAAQSQDPYNVPVTDPVTLSPGTLSVPVQEQDPIQQPLPAETVAPEDVPVNPVQDPSQTPKPTDTIKLLKVDLTGIFPFCIPWDIYNLLSKFVSDPVTPSVDWDWGRILGFLGINTVSHLDLHDYDGVAEILRNMETVVFCIGLAYATKKVFIK